MKVLVIEDDIDLQQTISQFLSRENYVCEPAKSYLEAKKKLSLYDYDIILLDITLPDGNGLKLLESIRENAPETGVIIISAKNSLDDKILGLDIGADDYLSKPFQLSELNSRIKALLRRRQYGGNNTLIFNEISLDTQGMSVFVNDNLLELTRKEYDILLFLFINKGRVLTKECIAEHLWEDNIEFADNYDFIYIHINNIRKKIKAAGGNNYIKTVYGMGYKFTDR